MAREALVRDGFNIAEHIYDIADTFDVITSFHVIEHLVDPLAILETASHRLANGGKLIIEVPHAGDLLLNSLDCNEFKQHTLWSQHLILHTKTSLTRLLETAGFTNIEVHGIQRYPLANHMYWLRHGKPGGHKKWKELTNPELDKAYSETLNATNATDTLIAFADRIWV